MANRLLLCLVIVCVVTNFSECGRFSSRGGGSRSRSSSSWGGSRSSRPSSSSSSRHSYPSSSSSLSGSSGHSSHSYPSSLSSLSGLGGTYKYPSSSSGLSGSSSGSSHLYPSSSSGLSGSGSHSNSWSPWSINFNKPFSSSGSSSKYPSSSGLSGSGSGSNKYPSSSGLSGSGSGSNKYPSSIGLSGSGSGSNKYPSSIGLSGSGSGSNKYPSSIGLSGSGSGSNVYPPSNGLSGSGAGSNKYPPSNGLSGSRISMTSTGNHNYPSTSGISGSNNYGSSGKHNYATSSSGSGNYNPSHTYPSLGSTNSKPSYYPTHTNTHNGFGSGHIYNSHNYYNTYASAPQHVYITEYRNSNSRYSDLLTGLALYNMGRSHSHYNHHYYNDDYYTRRYYSNGNSYSSNERPKDEAYCTLRIRENGKLEILKIPCEIVSTFTEGSKKLAATTESQTVCVSNYTVINSTHSATTVLPTVNPTSTTLQQNLTLPKNVSSSLNNKTVISELPASNTSTSDSLGIIPLNATKPSSPVELLNMSTSTLVVSMNESIIAANATNATTTITPLDFNISTTTSPPKSTQQDVILPTTVKPVNVTNNASLPSTVTSNIAITNSTKCTTTTDPLNIRGPPVNPTNMECDVEINTKEARLRTKVDCKVLSEYSKMPEPPKKESSILPTRSKLKSWLTNPPWWMSIFIAV